jgi:hypothetical protein
MTIKTLLKQFLSSEDFKRSRRLARIRAPRAAEVKQRIAAFLRGDESLEAFARAIVAAVEAQHELDGAPAPVFPFGGPGTALFVEALASAAPAPRLEAELRRALAGIDIRDPSEKLRSFAAFVARTAREAGAGADSNLHVGYATCFLSFCWHILYDLEVPVFYGASHKGVKALIAAGAVEDSDYGSRDLGERFRAFLRIARALRDLFMRVNAQLGYWTVDAFLEWYAFQADAAAAAAPEFASMRIPAAAVAEALAMASPQAAAPGASAEAAPAGAGPAPEAGATRAERPAEGAEKAGEKAPAEAPRAAAPISAGPSAEDAGRAELRGGAATPERNEPSPAPEASRAERAGPDTARLLARETFLPEDFLRDVEAVLLERGQLAIEGPSGVGKTFLARRLAGAVAGDPSRVLFLQLHPAYRYEDLIEARAPHPANGHEAAPGAVPGVLRTFAERAARAPQERFVAVLDELGRADALALLGECLALLDERDSEVVLPFSRAVFRLPRNLFIIATARAGLEEISLRRRFPAVRLQPEKDVLARFLEAYRPELRWVAEVFGCLNRMIAEDRDPGAMLGHGLFMRRDLDERELERIFRFEVRPYIDGIVADPARRAAYDLESLRAAACPAEPAGEPALAPS